MAKLTAVFGLLLIGNGIYGYTAGDSQSPTALIPAFVGIALLLCAVGSICLLYTSPSPRDRG